MRVSELSERTGVSIPTIKYYLREGLLPRGERTARNQAEYSESHVERLALIRALRDTAGFSMAAITTVVEAMEGGGGGSAVGVGVDLLGRQRRALDRSSAAYAQAWATVGAIIAQMGWRQLAEDDGVVQDTIRAYMTVQQLWPLPIDVERQMTYASAAQLIAEAEVPDEWDPDRAPEKSVEYAVLGMLLFEPVILALRRAADVARARALRAQKGRPARAARRQTRREKPNS